MRQLVPPGCLNIHMLQYSVQYSTHVGDAGSGESLGLSPDTLDPAERPQILGRASIIPHVLASSEFQSSMIQFQSISRTE